MGKKITDLQLRSAVADDVNFPTDDTIQSYRVTAAQIYTYLKTKLRATGVEALSSSVQSKAVTFGTAMPDANYVLDFCFQNTTDSDPIMLQGMITAKSTTGFTVSFNAPTDSANYKMNWKASY